MKSSKTHRERMLTRLTIILEGNRVEPTGFPNSSSTTCGKLSRENILRGHSLILCVPNTIVR